MIKGIDISHHQGKIDWKKVAADGIKFAYIKASQGASFVDKMAVENVRGAKEAGILCGLYHYFTPTGDAGAQFTNFWSVLMNCGGPKGLLTPVLDVEGDDKNQVDMGFDKYAESANAWLTYLASKTLRYGIVYTYPFFAYKLRGKLSKYPLWAASYPKLTLENGVLTGFPGWDNYTLWQYSNKGKVSGIKGYVDLDSANIDIKSLVI